MENTKIYIYILELEGGYYYVGRTKNLLTRLASHQSGGINEGSEWTKLHKPVNVVKIIENASVFDEDRYVKECMAMYGIQNVRGGSYSNINLSESQLYTLQKEIRNAHDCCFKCGEKGHFAKNCVLDMKKEIVDPENYGNIFQSQNFFAGIIDTICSFFAPKIDHINDSKNVDVFVATHPQIIKSQNDENKHNENTSQTNYNFDVLKNPVAEKNLELDGFSSNINIPKNKGKKWTENDDVILCSKFDQGESLEKLAVLFGRSKVSIQYRLYKYGRADKPE